MFNSVKFKITKIPNNGKKICLTKLICNDEYQGIAFIFIFDK